jgi:hypothetical protein
MAGQGTATTPLVRLDPMDQALLAGALTRNSGGHGAVVQSYLMPLELVILLPWLVIVGGLIKWLVELRSTVNYRASQDKAIAAKDAQLAQMQESVKAQLAQMQETVKIKDALIESLKQLQYADALRHMTAQREIFEQRLAELTMKLEEADRDRLSREQVAEIRGRRDEVAGTVETMRIQASGILNVSETAQVGVVVVSQEPGISPPERGLTDARE